MVTTIRINTTARDITITFQPTVHQGVRVYKLFLPTVQDLGSSFTLPFSTIPECTGLGLRFQIEILLISGQYVICCVFANREPRLTCVAPREGGGVIRRIVLPRTAHFSRDGGGGVVVLRGGGG
jgi:hypothetical protein